MNSLPLSDLKTFGRSRSAKTLSNVSITLRVPMKRSTLQPTHSRVNSSTIWRICTGPPVGKRRAMKSLLQTGRGLVEGRVQIDPGGPLA